MPVDVKSYLASMKSISSQTTSKIKNGTANQNDLKTQALLAQLIEALSYANSMDFRKKTLNATNVDNKTGQEVLKIMKEQEKLVKQLADGQALSKDQADKLTKAIDRFYEMSGTAEVNYKKFAENMEKFAMQDLPEAVKTRIINDSRDAHIIGKEQLDKENPVLNTLKRIKNYVEDAAESTKQYRKKLFVTLDQFKEGFLDAFDKLGEAIENSGFFDNLIKSLQGLGALALVLQGFIKEGDYGIPMLVKQFNNLKTAFKAFKEVGGSGKGISRSFKTVGNMAKGLKMIVKQFKFLPKLIEKFGLGKGLGAAAKGIGKGLAKGLGKKALKKIPVIGSLISIWMAVDRWKKGDKAGSLIEIASGTAALFPGIGTLVSIGLDLINLGRDKNVFSKMQEKVESKIPHLKENALFSIPIIGQIFGLKKTAELWHSGDKFGALKMAIKTLYSIMPGGAWLFDVLTSIFTAKWGEPSSANNRHNVIRMDGSSEYGSQRGAGDTISLGDKLAQSAISIGGSRTSSTGWCALKVGDAIEKTDPSIIRATGRGNAWTWINKLKGPGSKWFNYAGKARTNKDLANLAPGSIAVWDKQNAHPYGHIEIADGKGHLISDFSRPANLNLYRRNPAGIKPDIFVPKGVKVPVFSNAQEETSNSSDFVQVKPLSSDIAVKMAPDEVANTIKTSDDAVSAYTAYMDKLQGELSSISGAQTVSGTSWANPRTSKPSSSQALPEAKPPASSMKTDIDDTAIAILNSVLFK